MIEYLAGLYRGSLRGTSREHIVLYGREYLPNYSEDSVRVLYEAFRNRVNHYGVATGIWVDRSPATRGRRVVWTIKESEQAPAIEVCEDSGTLITDSPWECRYTHRTTIRLGRLWRDIKASADLYIEAISSDKALQGNFEACMRQLYPD